MCMYLAGFPLIMRAITMTCKNSAFLLHMFRMPQSHDKLNVVVDINTVHVCGGGGGVVVMWNKITADPSSQ